MAIKDTQSKRLPAARLEKARFTLTAISQLRDYAPHRKEFGADKVIFHQDALRLSREAEIAAENALAKARDAAAKAEWDAYNFSITTAEQVMGQFGSSSDEYSSLGYKKKSEYRKSAPGSRTKQAKADSARD